MKEIYSIDGDVLLGIKHHDDWEISKPARFSDYTVLLLNDGDGIYHADFGKFPFKSPALLFSTPLQQIYIEQIKSSQFTMLQFHGDFYCIEYHKVQVACNGLLFNNIYLEPSVKLTGTEQKIFESLLQEMEEELKEPLPDEIVLRSYLQLFLAKASSIKTRSITSGQELPEKDEQMELFMKLLDKHYLVLHKPNDYANLLNMTLNNFSRRCSGYFKKAPSVLIQERLILEAKKKLHLTRQSVKEIAYSLNFSDEFYFSRFFKKFTKVSPLAFRNKTGISIVADLGE